MKKYLPPIRILIIYLSLMAVFASISWSGNDYSEYVLHVRNFGLLLIPSFLTYKVLVALKLGTPTRWEHRVISMLILFLLFDVSLPWWLFVCLGVGTELIQRLVRSKFGPIFNPAAVAGLVASTWNYLPGWWGVSFAPRIQIISEGISVATILTIIIAGYVAYTYRKLWIVFSGLIALAVTYFIAFGRNPLFLVFEGTLAFFFVVMVVEPKTSPVVKQQQIIFGSLVGVLSILLLKINFTEAYLGALLVANLGYIGYRLNQMPKQPAAVAPATPAPQQVATSMPPQEK